VKRLFPLAALAAALAAAWLPLVPPHAIAGHSALADLVRGEAFHAAVAGGDRWPAWLPDLYDRHGSPLPSFYAPLSYLVVEVLRWGTGDGVAALKLAVVLFWIAGAAGAGAAARAAFGAGAGIPAAAAFALAPYLLADVYVRAGVAELAALALAPWGLAALLSRSRRAAEAGALALAALVLAHNVTALLALPALALVALAGGVPERRRALGVVAFALALSAFFWLPALAEKRFLWADESLTAGFFDYERHFVSPLDLLPFRTSLAFTVGPHERSPFRFGELLLAGVLAAPLLSRRLAAPARRRALVLAAGAAVALVATTALAAPLWRALPLARFVQFPFRFFLLATVLAAPLVGLAVARAPERWRPWLAGAVAAAALLLARPALDVRYLFLARATALPVPVAAAGLERALSDPALAEPGELVTLERLRRAHWSATAGHEFLPRTVSELPAGPEAAAAEARGAGVEVLASEWGYPEVRAEIRVSAPGELALGQFWFPGWRVEVDGRARAARAEPGRGRILVAVAPGDRRVVARFAATPLRRGAAAASIAVAALGALLASRRKDPSAT